MHPRVLARLIGVCFLLPLLLSRHPLQAQSSAYYQVDPDSLRQVLAGQRSDTARVRILQHLVDIDPDETSDLRQLVPLLKRLRHPQYRAYRLWLAGAQLPQPWNQQSPAALHMTLDSLQAAVRAFDQTGRFCSVLYGDISAACFFLHGPTRARTFLTQQLTFYLRQPARWWQSASRCLGILGGDYLGHGDYNHAIENYLREDELWQAYNRTDLDSSAYSFRMMRIGTAYADWGNYAKAQHYFQRALRPYPVGERVPEKKLGTLIYVETRLAELYQQQRRFAEALRVVEQALHQQVRVSNSKKYATNSYLNAYPSTELRLHKSSLLLDQQRVAEAGQLLLQARHLARTNQLDTVTFLRWDVYWARYYTQRRQVARAQLAWRRAYRQALVVHQPRLRLDYARQIAQFYQAQHQPALAAPYALVALHLADSLTALQGPSLVARYEVVQADRAQATRLAQTQRQQRQATAQAQRQRRALLYSTTGGLGLLLLAGVLYAAFRRARRLAQLVTAQKQDLQQQRDQLEDQRDQLDHSLTDLRATQAQLLQKEKMASLGELTAGIAHEIQNPLNFVNNFADVSQELVAELEAAQAAGDGVEVTALAADVRENLRKIAQHGQRASGIVRGMLAHSRSSTGERQPTDVNTLCEEYLRLAYHGLRAKDQTFNAELQADLAPTLPLVAVVPGDLGRVLLNLLTNAFYAVQQRQRTGEAGYVPTVRVQTKQVGKQVEIQVQDNGTGMSPEVQAKIFQPFFTTKPTGEGTGLGLSLSYDIVTQGHGGSLTVESQVGQGSTFTVRLPVPPQAQSGVAQLAVG